MDMNCRGEMWEGGGWAGWSGVKGGKLDKCNSIINKCIFKKTYGNPSAWMDLEIIVLRDIAQVIQQKKDSLF